MKAADLRTKTVDDLKQELLELRKEQLNLRFQRSTGQLENTAEMARVRKQIARLKTVKVEKENGIEISTAPKAKKPAAKKETKKAEAKKPAAKKAPAKKAPAKKDKKA